MRYGVALGVLVRLLTSPIARNIAKVQLSANLYPTRRAICLVAI